MSEFNERTGVVQVELGDPRYCQRGQRHEPHTYHYTLPGGVTGRYECEGQPWPGAPDEPLADHLFERDPNTRRCVCGRLRGEHPEEPTP